MKKILAFLLMALLFSVTAFCADTVLFDFGNEADSTFGIGQNRLGNVSYDNESISWTNELQGNSGIMGSISSYDIDGSNYRYVVSRLKIENNVTTTNSNYRFYFSRVNKKTGNITHDLWATPYESFSASVPYDKNGEFITYAFDLTKYPALCTGEEKIDKIFYGAGLDTGTAGVKVYSDFLAFVPEDEYNVKVYLNQNTNEELFTPLPQYTTVPFGTQFTFDSLPYRRAGYKISGWSLSGNAEAADLSCIKGETTLYAIWEEDSDIYVNFNSNTTDNVSGIPSYSIVQDGTYTFDGDSPEREGYYFTGWSSDKDASIGSYTFDNITKSITLYAIWIKAEPVQIKYEANRDGDTVEFMPMRREVTAQKGMPFSLPEKAPERDGFEFLGWSTSLAAKDIVQDGFIPTADTTLYAIWSDSENYNDVFTFTPEELYKNMTSGRCAISLMDGYVKIVPTDKTNYDVFIQCSNGFSANLNAKAIDKVLITAEFIAADSLSFTSQLFTRIDSDSNYKESHSVKASGSSSDGKKVYTFDLSSASFWQDAETLVNFRYDPFSTEGFSEVRIYEIAFVSEKIIASFDGTGSDSGETNAVVSQSGSVTLPPCGFIKKGFAFNGWTDGKTVYEAGETITLSQSTVFKPIWALDDSLSSAKVLYPGFARKAFIFGSDDGANADKRVIETFNKHGIKGSFNLIAKSYSNYTAQQLESLRKTYEGHEIVSHSYSHFAMMASNTAKTDEDCLDDIVLGENRLEEIFNCEINGFIWPISKGDRPAVLEYTNDHYLWSRMAPEEAGGDYFAVPEAFKPNWRWTCVDWNNNKNFIDRYTEEYLGLETDRLTLYSLWCHANNYDAYNLWDVFDAFIKNYTQSGQNIWNPYPTEYVKYINASRELVIKDEYIFNPTEIDIYLQIGDKQLVLPAYSIYDGKAFDNSKVEFTDGNAKVTYYADATAFQDGFNIVIAGYDNEKVLSSIKICKATGGTVEKITEALDGKADIETVKIFSFDNLNNISPISKEMLFSK